MLAPQLEYHKDLHEAFIQIATKYPLELLLEASTFTLSIEYFGHFSSHEPVPSYLLRQRIDFSCSVIDLSRDSITIRWEEKAVLTHVARDTGREYQLLFAVVVIQRELEQTALQLCDILQTTKMPRCQRPFQRPEQTSLLNSNTCNSVNPYTVNTGHAQMTKSVDTNNQATAIQQSSNTVAHKSKSADAFRHGSTLRHLQPSYRPPSLRLKLIS